MEIRVTYTRPAHLQELQKLKLNGDYYPSHARLYVTPDELSRIKDLGIRHTILIDDMNDHYKDYWAQHRTSYHSYQEIVDLADSLATHCPEICMKTVYGTSYEGRELAALKISDNVETDEPEPEIIFDGGIHGDEIGAAENVIRFARHLCKQYENNNPDITFLVDNREIWLYYMVNPDGRENMSRYNANGVDINRDWGYMWDAWGNSPGAFSQIESKALRECMYTNQFVVHTTYHSGTEYISCPWSYRSSAPPDSDHILHLAGIYSGTSGYDNLEYGQGSTGMYPINGATKDGNYGTMGSISWSMEISNSKQPPASQLMHYYNMNVPAMEAMIEYAGYGLEGTVTDAETGDPLQALVYVDDGFPVYTDSTAGDYHKYVVPGIYDITVIASGYESQTINGIEVQDLSSTVTDFMLTPQDTPRQYAYKIPSCQIPDNNPADEGNTKAVFGAPDNINYSIGKNGWVIVDMQKPITDRPGNDLIVYEGDDTPEGFNLYISETMDGPWLFWGTGEGTTEFELSQTPFGQVQFIKIVDDGDGPGGVDDAGFDLDAVSDLEHIWGVFLVLYDYELDDSTGNANQRIDPGETVELIVDIGNNGNITANNTTGHLTTTSPYITFEQDSASFGTLAQGENATGTFVFTAGPETPIGEHVEFTLTLSANSGLYSVAYDLEFDIGQYPILILDLDGNHNSGPVMASTLQDMDLAFDIASTFPEDLGMYKSVFLCLGIHDNNYILTNAEGQELSSYLSANGRLYMEGGDTWAYDPETPVHPMFGITGENDGGNDLGMIMGQDGSFAEDMIFMYSGDNEYIDRISCAASAPEAFELFRNQIPSYCNAVARDAGDYKTVGTSFEFGGLEDGASTKEELMLEILEFFGGILTQTPEHKDDDHAILNPEVYPNPVKGNATIEFLLKEKMSLRIEVFNMQGQQTEVLSEKTFDPGKHRIHWKPGTTDHDAGLYFYRISSGTTVKSGKMIYLK